MPLLKQDDHDIETMSVDIPAMQLLAEYVEVCMGMNGYEVHLLCFQFFIFLIFTLFLFAILVIYCLWLGNILLSDIYSKIVK